MAHWALGMPIGVGFVLGAIVAPPDIVAPLAIVRQLGIPRRIAVVLNGEGVANDATALIIYRFAIAAVGTGLFSFGAAAGTFVLIVIGEIAYGIAIGWLSLRLRRWAQDPRVEITLSLMTPYAAFLVPAHLGGSGVLATVATGLFVSWNGPLLIPAATRLQGIFFWDLLIYLLESLIFLVTGLQLRTLLDRPDIVPLSQPILGVLLTVIVLIVTRFVWVYPAAYLPRWLSEKVARRDPLPPWQTIFFIAFVGVRGVVSLAAALAIPLTVSSGAPFPYRDLILFITFGVIVVTLVGQGLSLPSVVRWLGLGRHAADERTREQKAEFAARMEALKVAEKRLEERAAKEQIPPEVLAILRARHDYRTGRLPEAAPTGFDAAWAAANVRSDLIGAEREYIYRLLQQGRITDEARRRMERELDLEEASIACKKEGGVEPPL
jgi:monovalent cation/hydrogen antiporter